MDRRTSRSLTVLAAVLPTVLAVAGPASAGDKSTYTSKTSGGQAFVEWIEHDPDPADALGLPGNTHVGSLGVYAMPGFLKVFGTIDDYECAPGEVPGGGHGEPGADDPATCELKGTRFLSGTKSTALAIDARAGVARLTGDLLVSNGGHGEPGEVLATPPADITWTSNGVTSSFRRSETWTDGTSTFRSSVRGTAFEAAITGRIGGMGFTGDDDDASSGYVEQWSERSRERIG